MKKSIKILFYGLVMSILFSVTAGFAVQDFSVSSAINHEKALNEAVSEIITITNTGNESITLDISDTDLTYSSTTIILTLSDSSITLANGDSTEITVDYNSGAIHGDYTGKITVVNSANSSHSKDVSITSTIRNDFNYIVFLKSNTGNTTYNVLELTEKVGEEADETFYMKNVGDVDLDDVDIDTDDFESSTDDIDDKYLDINSDDVSDFGLKSLKEGENQRFKIEIQIPDSAEVDNYEAPLDVDYEIDGIKYVQRFYIKLITTPGDEDIQVNENYLNMRDGELYIIAEQGESIDNIEFEVVNVGGGDAYDLSFEFEDSYLEEENSDNLLSYTSFSFDPEDLDIDGGDEEIIEIDLDVSEDQAVGTYTGKVNILNSVGDELESFDIKVKIVGDIYIDNIEYDDSVKPGDILDIKITIVNDGSQVQRNIKIDAVLEDIDTDNGDIDESSSTFLLDSKSERIETIRFKIPDEATHGVHTLELRLDYSEGTIIEVEDVEVVRALHNIEVKSANIEPRVLKCDTNLYSFIKIQNLGRYDESIRVTTEIVGTDIKEETNTVDLDINDIVQKTLNLDISELAAGDYKVIQKVYYTSSLFVKEEFNIRVDQCSDSAIGGIDVEELNDTITNQTQTNTSISLFGEDFEKNTVYLASGIGAIFVLIIISLFFL